MSTRFDGRLRALERATGATGVLVVWDSDPMPDDIPRSLLVVRIWRATPPDRAKFPGCRAAQGREQSYRSVRDGKRVHYVGWYLGRASPWWREGEGERPERMCEAVIGRTVAAGEAVRCA
jgi:hypothetical protein